MAKKSALDLKIAECDVAIAAAHEELARWRALRVFLTGDDSPFAGVSSVAQKPKRTLGKNKPKPATLGGPAGSGGTEPQP